MTEFVSKEHHSNLTQRRRTNRIALCCCAAWLACNAAQAQVFTVGAEQIPSRYSEIKRTHVDLPSQPLLQRTKLELVRVLDSEQGFAMRPLPKGSKGMVLQANGLANPNGSEYVKSLEHNGVAFQAADRVQITDMKIFPDKIVFELNGGPDKKHRILRHISVGVGGMQAPLARDDGQDPLGVRLTLQFEKYVPEMTGTQVKELLEPLVDFKLKSPVQAYTDTLPTALREAILAHHVLVGMNAEMVRYAVGPPDSKIREREGQMPFEEWIYGEPPKDVEFVRFNGNRVIQVEDAKLGQPPIIRNQDEMGEYWNTAPNPNIHEVKLGDVRSPSENSQTAPSAPPTLRKPGETLPADSDKDTPSMQKVQFPPGMDGSGKPSNPPPAQPGAQTTTPAGGGNSSPNPVPNQYRTAFM
jgi:hypothetical protein